MPVISGPALGVDFFDREDEVKAILESLRRDNILLVAPRRYGKTSVMRKVERTLTENGYLERNFFGKFEVLFCLYR